MDGKRTRKSALRILGLTVVLAVVVMITFERKIYDFLAIPTRRVNADVLIVEGWGGTDIARAAVREYNPGQYRWVVVAAAVVDGETESETRDPSAQYTANQLVEMGIPSDNIIVVAPVTDGWNKTSKAASAACATLLERQIQPRGLNVVTLGLHARRSRLAYEHAIGSDTPVGNITVPSRRFVHRAWWTSRAGVFLVVKNFTGWVRECLLG